VARPNPARLVIALAIATCLAIFLVYTSIAGGGTPSLQPSELKGHEGKLVTLSGKVVGSYRVDQGVARFRLRDVKGTKSVPAVYRDTLPPQFKVGRDVSLDGRLKNGVFVGTPDSMVTKCPSKYTDKKT
jgi:cytochrome c-type biogenesis protein CcmE